MNLILLMYANVVSTFFSCPREPWDEQHMASAVAHVEPLNHSRFHISQMRTMVLEYL